MGAFRDNLQVNQEVVWTDTSMVLKWINNDVGHHKYFVARCVQMIVQIEWMLHHLV